MTTTGMEDLAAGGSSSRWTFSDAHTLEAFELVERRWWLVGTYGDDAVVRIPPFEQVELAVGRIFIAKAR